MKISKLNIIQFRHLNNLTFDLGSTITVIAGGNGTGKTSLLGLVGHIFRFSKSEKSFQCRSARNLTYPTTSKSTYIKQFKLTYFRQVLVKSYNNSEAIQEIIASDHSGFQESILTEDDYRLIDSLTTIDNEKIKIDSTKGSRRAEGAKGKRPLEFILDELDGKYLLTA